VDALALSRASISGETSIVIRDSCSQANKEFEAAGARILAVRAVLGLTG
jgi:hypothetical protein